MKRNVLVTLNFCLIKHLLIFCSPIRIKQWWKNGYKLRTPLDFSFFSKEKEQRERKLSYYWLNYNFRFVFLTLETTMMTDNLHFISYPCRMFFFVSSGIIKNRPRVLIVPVVIFRLKKITILSFLYCMCFTPVVIVQIVSFFFFHRALSVSLCWKNTNNKTIFSILRIFLFNIVVHIKHTCTWCTNILRSKQYEKQF